MESINDENKLKVDEENNKNLKIQKLFVTEYHKL